MKKTSFFCVLVFSISCTEIIDVEVPSSETRLVVVASIDWEKGTTGNEQTIHLRTSTPYFETGLNDEVTDADVQIFKHDTQSIIPFVNKGDGTYVTGQFEPELNVAYTLKIIYNGDEYVATEVLTPVASIKGVHYSLEAPKNDKTKVNIFFDDPAQEENHYIIIIENKKEALPYMRWWSDKYNNGNEINVSLQNESISYGDSLEINLHSISKQYYNYLETLDNNMSDAFFGVIPIPLNGNCINSSDTSKNAYGYFRVTQKDSKLVFIKD